MNISIPKLIISGVIISMVGGLVGGVIHTILSNSFIIRRAEGICIVVGKKGEKECKSIVKSVMEMTDEDFQGYVSNGGSGE